MLKKSVIFFLAISIILTPYSFNFIGSNYTRAETIVDYMMINGEVTWDLAGSPYLINEDGIFINLGATLTIEPGVVVKFYSNASIIVAGEMIAQGTAEKKVVFTSVYDNEHGGDTSPEAREPEPGDWTGLQVVAKNGSLILDNAIIKYGGKLISSEPVLVQGKSIIRQNKVYAQEAEEIHIGAVSITNGSIIIENSILTNNIIALEIMEGSSGPIPEVSIHNSEIFSNTEAGVKNKTSYQVDATNNWWGHESGPYHSILNPEGQGDLIDGQASFIPWIHQQGGNQPPTIDLISQFKSDGETELAEKGITAGETVVFKAYLYDPDGDQVKLQVELKEYPQLLLIDDINSEDLLSSDFTPASSTAAIFSDILISGQYHWRARAIDEQGASSDWLHFGYGGSFDLDYDFKIKTVPLYTQVESQYPPRLPEDEWAGKDYIYGATFYSCSPGTRATIAKCGCAITSMVMLGRYYDINQGIDNSDSNPANINNWLRDNKGYSGSNLYWSKAIGYLGFREINSQGATTTKVRLSHDYYNAIPATQGAVIDDYIMANKPAVAFSSTYGHYFVVDSKIKTDLSGDKYTYGIKDPVWYNTRTLDEEKSIIGKVQNYHNTFAKANLLSYLEEPKKIAKLINVRLASPAELLITDDLERKLGKDPVTNTIYNDIPDAVYTEEGPIVSSEAPINVEDYHAVKVAYIPSPIAGGYNIQVIGTGQGSYTVTSLIYDNNGNSYSQTITGETQTNQSDEYNLNFTPDNPDDIIIEPVEITTEKFVALFKEKVSSSHMPKLLKKRLKSRMYIAEKLIKKDRIRAAKAILDSITRMINRRVNRGITPEEGEELIQIITDIKDSL